MFDGIFSLAVLTIFPMAMIAAGASDLVTMRISNMLTGGLALSFLVLAPLSGMEWSVLVWHLIAGAVTLVVAIALFAPGWIGGGDAKLFAATGLWLGWDLLPYYALIVAIGGGLLTLVMLRFRNMPLPAWVEGQTWIAELHRADRGVPYGLALAAGGLAAYSDSAWLMGGTA